MDAMQLSTNSSNYDGWTNSSNPDGSTDSLDSQTVDFLISMGVGMAFCLIFAFFSIYDFIRSWASLEYQRLLLEKGTTERAAITKKEKVNKDAENKEKKDPVWVWELDYTVKVAGPNGEQTTMKVTKQQVAIDSPAAAGLDEAETVEVMLLPSRPYAVDLKEFAMVKVEVNFKLFIGLQVCSQTPGLLLLCFLLSMYYGQWNPPMFTLVAGLWILLCFVFAVVLYLRHEKLDLRFNRTGQVTLMNTGAKEAFLA